MQRDRDHRDNPPFTAPSTATAHRHRLNPLFYYSFSLFRDRGTVKKGILRKRGWLGYNPAS